MSQKTWVSNMKVAVCYSGMLRNLMVNFDNHNEYFLSKYDCDIFLDLWDVYGYGTYEKRYDSFSEDKITEEDKKNIIEKIKPKDYRFEEFKTMESFFDYKEKTIDPKRSNVPPYPKNILSMFYKIKKCGELVKRNHVEYDVIVKTRCDLFHKEEINLEQPKDNTIYVNEIDGWGVSAVGDRFLYGNPKTMEILHSTYDNVENLWLNRISILSAPEHVLYTHLNENNLIIDKKPIWLEILS